MLGLYRIINFTKWYIVNCILLSRVLSRELDQINHHSLSLRRLVTRV